MNFLTSYQEKIILFDGPMETRLLYEEKIILGNNAVIAHLIYDDNVSKKMERIYREYIELAQQYTQPILLNLPTYRASLEHLSLHHYSQPGQIKKINHDCYLFVSNICDSYQSPTEDIFIVAPVGSKNDAYSPELKLSAEAAERYHATQINALAQTEVDLINITTMPSMTEALGCAKIVGKTQTPYTIGFVLSEEGKLLDGTELHDAIKTIDNSVNVKPLCYLLICTHPSVAKKLLLQPHAEYVRIKGIKANGSCKPLNELATSNQALADPAEQFAIQTTELAKKYHWKIVGGCCGTDNTHLEAIARLLK